MEVDEGTDDMGTESDSGWLAPRPLPNWADEHELAAEVETGLHSECPEESLRSLLYQWFDRGLDEAQALGVLYNVQDQVRRQEREADDETIDEIVSCLVGWCGPDGLIRRRS